jgi:parallel beta-helix repeat protein
MKKMMTKYIKTILIIACTIIALSIPSSVDAAVCDKTLNVGGNLQGFVSSLQSNKTGCLETGVYPAPVTLSTPYTTLRSVPGQKRATISGGQVRIAASAYGARLDKLKMITPSTTLSPLVYASEATISNSDITGPSICVIVDVYPPYQIPYRVKIVNNYIHDCGHFPPTNFDHGIYLSDSNGAIIKNNVIVRNADRGIQLYSNANDSRIIGNIIDSNGEGIIFGDYSTNNLVRGNFISNPLLRFGVEAISFPGVENIVKNNCTWTPQLGYYAGVPLGSGIMPVTNGFTAINNIVEQPNYENGYDQATCGSEIP